MVSQDWVVALVVAVVVTVLVYLIGRRLDGGVAPTDGKPRPDAGPPTNASKRSAKKKPAASDRPLEETKSVSTVEEHPRAAKATKKAPTEVATAKPKAAKKAPTEVATAKPKAAAPKEDAVARVDYEEDDENDPTRVGASTANVVLEKVVYSPKLHRITFDPEVAEPEGSGAQLLVHARAQTDTGLRRKRNEDSLLVLESEGVFVVADGMGGYRGGELASKLAVQTIESAYREKSFDGPVHEGVPSDATDLARAIQMANTAILDMAKQRPELEGMGTTVCAARFSKTTRRLYVGHVGDSRCYRFRGGTFKQMTADHTMADHGVTGPEAAQLSRAVGVWPTVPIDIVMAAPVTGDVYLLCSDGLSKMLKNDAIGSVVGAEEDPQAAVERLVSLANARGGKDNISVILVRVVHPDWKPTSAAPGASHEEASTVPPP